MHRRGVSAAVSRSLKEGFQPTLSILVGLYDPLGHKTRQDHGPHGQQTTLCSVHAKLRGIASMVKLR